VSENVSLDGVIKDPAGDEASGSAAGSARSGLAHRLPSSRSTRHSPQGLPAGPAQLRVAYSTVASQELIHALMDHNLIDLLRLKVSRSCSGRRAALRRDQRQETHAPIRRQVVDGGIVYLTYQPVRDA
jgi:hypothetical protein